MRAASRSPASGPGGPGRLLPASLTVLAVCAAATVAWLPQTRWPQVMSEVLASALYFAELAARRLRAVDYFTSAQTASPVTHFWSLSVEEQFYLVWPLLVLGTWWLASRRGSTGTLHPRGLTPRGTVGIALAVLGAASLAFAAGSIEAHPDAAYFITPGRVWEFAAGGVLATLPASPAADPPGGWRFRGGCDGRQHLVLRRRSGVPGLLTLLPVAGCALVSGRGMARPDVPFLGAALPVWLGDISYSVYLWHWPLIVFAPYPLDRPMSPRFGLVILLVSLLAAQLATMFIEEPVRRARRSRAAWGRASRGGSPDGSRRRGRRVHPHDRCG